MKIGDNANRDMQLLRLLTERQLDQEGCDTSMMRGATIDLVPASHRDDRQKLVLRFDLEKGVRVTVTDYWWHDRDRKIGHIVEQADEVARSVEALWRKRENIKDMRDEVAAAVRREVANARRRDIPYRFVSADICPVEAGSTEFPYAHVRLERLGASLMSEIVTLEFDEAEQVKPSFAEMLETQKARRTRQIALQQAAADGEIDEVALRIMKIRGCDVPAVLAKLPLADGGILDVDLAEKGSRGMVLFWRDGVVRANIRVTESMSWKDGTVTFRKVPDRFPAKPHGRLLSEIVEHEAFPDGLRIVSGYRSGETASADVARRTMLFNSRTGEAWTA